MKCIKWLMIIGFAFQMTSAYALDAKTAPAKAPEAKEIGKITKFTGAVSILSGSEITKVTAVGQKLKTGDRIKTDEGEVEIEMADGAMMKVSPYTVAGSDERVEKKGILFWKKDEDARRVTCYVGKLWFKSGEKSEKKNYLQTPTAVCALRGSDGDVGFDNKSSFLNMYHGTVTIQGNVNQGAFGNFGRNTAAGSAVYNAISRAIQAAESTRVAGQAGPAKEIVDLKAEKAVLAAVQAAAEALLNSPDPAVQAEAQAVAIIAQAEAKALDARIVVEVAKIEVAATQAELAAAQAAGDAAKVADLQKEVIADAQVVAEAQAAVVEIVAQLVTVTEAFVAGDFSEVNNIAEEVIVDAQEVINTSETKPVVEQVINATTEAQVIEIIAPPEAIPYENQ